MRICLVASIVGTATLVASGAMAQSTIRAGDTINATLSSQDRQWDDGSYYRCYAINTAPDTSYVVTMASESFDTFLSAGPGKDCAELSMSNDDGPEMGTNSELTFASAGGIWTIRANTLEANETGPFSLSVSRGETITPTRDILPIQLGSSVAGALTMGDRRADDGSYYDCYRLQMRSEDTVAIRLDSDSFDAFLGLYSGQTCEGEAISTDDDAGGGTSALIVRTLGTGTYSIRANSLGSSATGDYRLGVTVSR